VTSDRYLRSPIFSTPVDWQFLGAHSTLVRVTCLARLADPSGSHRLTVVGRTRNETLVIFVFSTMAACERCLYALFDTRSYERLSVASKRNFTMATVADKIRARSSASASWIVPSQGIGHPEEPPQEDAQAEPSLWDAASKPPPQYVPVEPPRRASEEASLEPYVES
jgi:hypothetical protein